MKLEVARPLGLAVIVVAVFVIIVPFANIVPNVFPPKFGVRDWRFGAVGYFLTALTLPTLGLGLLAVGGVLRESRSALRLSSVLAGLLTLLAVVGIAVFVSDGSALRSGNTEPGVRRLFNLGLTRTLVLSLLAVPALIAVALGSHRAAGALAAGEQLGKSSGLFVSGTS